MAKSIRVSDNIYDLAATTAIAVSRSLADQFEYWAKIGAAIDAAGITLEQSLQLLDGDVDLKSRLVEHVVAARNGRRQRIYNGDSKIATTRARIEAEVVSGKRTPESLVLFSRERAQSANLTFAEEPASSDPTW